MHEGVIPALLTPFDEHGALDFEALDRLIDRLIDQKVAGLFITGTTGEFVSLSFDERTQVIRHAVKRAKGKVATLVHVGAYNTEVTVALAQFAHDHKADAIGLLPPYFYGMDEESMYQHFSAVLKNIPSPTYLYNLPQCAGNEVPLSLIVRLKEEFSHLAGIKDSQGDMGRLFQTIDLGLPDFEVICGDDESTLTALKMGARASVTSAGNVFPDAFDAVYDAFHKGDMDGARAAQERLNRLAQLTKTGRFVGMYKEALRLMGCEVGWVRPPQRRMSSEEIADLKSGLTEMGYL